MVKAVERGHELKNVHMGILPVSKKKVGVHVTSVNH